MREIKFRAWHNIDGYMIYPKDCTKFEINFSCMYEGFSFRIEQGNGESVMMGSHEHITLMQYTGLKCEDGNEQDIELYEGDILVEYPNKYWVIYFDEGMFCIQSNDEELAKSLTDGLQCKDGNSLTYVGNKFENPELIS